MCIHIVYTIYLYSTPLEGINRIEGKKKRLTKPRRNDSLYK